MQGCPAIGSADAYEIKARSESFQRDAVAGIVTSVEQFPSYRIYSHLGRGLGAVEKEHISLLTEFKISFHHELRHFRGHKALARSLQISRDVEVALIAVEFCIGNAEEHGVFTGLHGTKMNFTDRESLSGTPVGIVIPEIIIRGVSVDAIGLGVIFSVGLAVHASGCIVEDRLAIHIHEMMATHIFLTILGGSMIGGNENYAGVIDILIKSEAVGLGSLPQFVAGSFCIAIEVFRPMNL